VQPPLLASEQSVPFREDHLSVAGGAHAQVDLTMSSASTAAHSPGYESTSKPLPPAKIQATNPVSSSTVWPGHTYQLHHCNGNGTHYFFKVTSFKYLVAFWICILLMAWAVSQVFLKWTRRFEPLDLHDFVGFPGQESSEPFSQVTSGHLQEELVFKFDTLFSDAFFASFLSFP
jgi:hypothetical protein